MLPDDLHQVLDVCIVQGFTMQIITVTQNASRTCVCAKFTTCGLLGDADSPAFLCMHVKLAPH